MATAGNSLVAVLEAVLGTLAVLEIAGGGDGDRNSVAAAGSSSVMVCLERWK